MSIQLDAIESNAIQPDESAQSTGDAQPGALPAQNTSRKERQSNACSRFCALRPRIHIIFKFVSALAITVISFIAIPAWLETRRATRIAEWTAEKDYIEYCTRLIEKDQPLTDSCVTALKQKLVPPPGFSDDSGNLLPELPSPSACTYALSSVVPVVDYGYMSGSNGSSEESPKFENYCG